MNKKLVALLLLIGVSGFVFTGCNMSEPDVEDTENGNVIEVIEEELVEPMEDEVTGENMEDEVNEENMEDEVVGEDVTKTDETMEEEVTE